MFTEVSTAVVSGTLVTGTKSSSDRADAERVNAKAARITAVTYLVIFIMFVLSFSKIQPPAFLPTASGGIYGWLIEKITNEVNEVIEEFPPKEFYMNLANIGCTGNGVVS